MDLPCAIEIQNHTNTMFAIVLIWARLWFTLQSDGVQRTTMVGTVIARHREKLLRTTMHLQKNISKEPLHPYLAPILLVASQPRSQHLKRVTEDWAVAVFHGHKPHLSGPQPHHTYFW